MNMKRYYYLKNKIVCPCAKCQRIAQMLINYYPDKSSEIVSVFGFYSGYSLI